MRTFHSALLAAMLALASLAHSQEYLPPPCEVVANPPPEWFRCAEPYVEMDAQHSDEAFSRAWYCESNDHSLGLLRDGGCAGSRGHTMFLEWSVPEKETMLVAQAGTQETDFYAEVMEWVVEPCMEVAVALDVKVIRKDQLDLGFKRTDIAKVMAASRDAAARNLAGQMKADATWEDRRAAYPLMLQICLQSLSETK